MLQDVIPMLSGTNNVDSTFKLKFRKNMFYVDWWMKYISVSL